LEIDLVNEIMASEADGEKVQNGRRPSSKNGTGIELRIMAGYLTHHVLVQKSMAVE
jgi:hypothetical protein